MSSRSTTGSPPEVDTGRVPVNDAETIRYRLLALYPCLDGLDPPLWQHWLQPPHAHPILVTKGTVLFEEGQPCRGFPMVFSGEVRVARGHADGRAIELYRVSPGELCVASTSCLFGQSPLVAHGVAAQDTELLLLGPQGFEALSAQAPFRRWVFGVFADRLADLMALTEAVAFQRLDQRLAAALLGHGPQLKLTHQALADELGTVREMVTRLLKRFERSGWVELGRERITLCNAPALRRLADGATDTTVR